MMFLPTRLPMGILLDVIRLRGDFVIDALGKGTKPML
jgi:hypothetical protein